MKKTKKLVAKKFATKNIGQNPKLDFLNIWISKLDPGENPISHSRKIGFEFKAYPIILGYLNFEDTL